MVFKIVVMVLTPIVRTVFQAAVVLSAADTFAPYVSVQVFPIGNSFPQIREMEPTQHFKLYRIDSIFSIVLIQIINRFMNIHRIPYCWRTC